MKIISRSFTFSMLFFLAFDTNSPLLGGMVTTFTGGTGVLVTETFTASDSVLNILVSPGNMSLGENTPFINALTLESVPEPGSALLLACGLALVLGRRQRANEGTLRPLIVF